jgi:hypothetical protein
MRSRNQHPASNEPHWTREEIRTVFLFWLFWSAYVCLAAIVVIALLTDWPEFLHANIRIFGR